ncbi:hypothetical protein KKG72_09920 [bacterium]|nr:hypothetical protein [bacterium]MBU1995367.1 hypothetical protein [bacterium]
MVRSRYAFSMIELIFAIVIIAITVMSLPMMSQITAKGVDQNLLQEAIFAAAAELNQAVTYQWDENDKENPDALSQVVPTTALDCNTTTKRRLGHVNQPLHRRCLENLTIRPSTTLGSDSGDLDDLDDTIKSSASILTDSSGGNVYTSAGYKEDYRSSISVVYADFGAATEGSQNIKKITVSIADKDDNLITVLKTYSANIGEIDYNKRTY